MNADQDYSMKLKKLYMLLEKTKQQMLGLDWESKLQIKKLESKIINEIKLIESHINQSTVVK
jgi:hypothetical protein